MSVALVVTLVASAACLALAAVLGLMGYERAADRVSEGTRQRIVMRHPGYGGPDPK